MWTLCVLRYIFLAGSDDGAGLFYKPVLIYHWLGPIQQYTKVLKNGQVIIKVSDLAAIV